MVDTDRAGGSERQTRQSKGFAFAGLTAYLLAADLVYTGQVEPPDVAMMGSMIRSLAAGAWDGLQAAGQLRSGNPPE